ncbi:hypothetical protein [Methylobacterium sp. E-046]|uniref:hypothetical protein n=1 Tax=Methylobacterium sp. E-046 TaxID=2836576 RepID=UPI001FB8F85D|nr:hypothetical protein [Methylobacterium sp. E-046]MCJ2102428.1 hypothetical protein [Methylobacterium sp. E-046]
MVESKVLGEDAEYRLGDVFTREARRRATSGEIPAEGIALCMLDGADQQNGVYDIGPFHVPVALNREVLGCSATQARAVL